MPLAAACGGDAEPLDATLADGGVVRVSASGHVQLAHSGRTVLSLALNRAPMVRRLEESFSGPFAIWQFDRENVEEVALSRYAGAEQLGDGVQVHDESEDGEVHGLLTIAPGTQALSAAARYAPAPAPSR